MNNIYLDSNYFFDISERDINKRKILNKKIVYISALTYHIMFYIYKQKVPNKLLLEYKKNFQVVDLTNEILDLALQGPTNDLEDNIQLHSAAFSNCEVFLTNDKKILNMKFFGKTKILSII